jgi:NAD(P)-dependent dehydrogenase (short-subunit alcohol dehydrogenase family)
MNRVKDKVAIVTGAARGIGRATARLLALEGAEVILTDIEEPAGRQAAEAIAGETGGRAHFLAHDVRDQQDWRQLVDHVLARHKRIDILVNNAGIYLIKPLPQTTLEDLESLWSVNVRGVFLGMRQVAPIMSEQRGGGAIVNISSMDGNVGSDGHTAYGGTKGAVRAMTKDVAIEFAKKKVRVNSIHPGYIHTEMAEMGARYYKQTIEQLGEDFPVGHIGQPNDVAYGVLYLASDESRFVTGAELAIDGGAMAE